MKKTCVLLILMFLPMTIVSCFGDDEGSASTNDACSQYWNISIKVMNEEYPEFFEEMNYTEEEYKSIFLEQCSVMLKDVSDKGLECIAKASDEWDLARCFDEYNIVDDMESLDEESFSCADGSDVIPADWVCDDENDCDDGSDELDCK